MKSTSAGDKRPIRIARTVVIRRPASDLYDFWRRLEHAAAVMPGNVSARETSDRTSHWTARGPGGLRVEWDAEIVRDEPGRIITWRSTEGSDVSSTGSVKFERVPQKANETRVKLDVQYTLPGGRLGALFGKALQKRASDEVAAGLQRVKQRLEAES